MQLKIPHKLTQEQAIAQINKLINDAQAQASTQGVTINDTHWEDNVFHFDITGQGQRISGTAAVLPDAYDIDVKLPLMMRMFEGRIKKMLEDQTRQALGQG